MMRTRAIDPAAYSTSANVDDLIDLRLALGYERWDIYGTSYGGRLALEAMRRDADAIRAVILDKPVPPGAVEIETHLATQYALQRVFASCEQQPQCQARFPVLEETLLTVYDTLNRAPLIVSVSEAGSRPAMLDGNVLAGAVRRLLRSRESIASLPLLLHELRSGDRARAAAQLMRFTRAGDGGRATFWLVQCFDQYSRDYVTRLDSLRSVAWRALRYLADDLRACPIWQNRFARPEEGAPVVSGIPTLVLTGEFDAQTPVEFGRRIASTLSRSYVFELRGETHSGRPSACRTAIIAEFSNDPQRRPAATCIAEVPPIAFHMTWP